MIRPLPFRLWSMLVSMGRLDMIGEHRRLRRAAKAVADGIMHDALHRGTGVMRIGMGDGCTPVVQRIDPDEFFIPPDARSMDDLPAPPRTMTREEFERSFGR